MMSRSILVLFTCSNMCLCAHGAVLLHQQDANPREPIAAKVSVIIIVILKVVLMGGCILSVISRETTRRKRNRFSSRKRTIHLIRKRITSRRRSDLPVFVTHHHE